MNEAEVVFDPNVVLYLIAGHGGVISVQVLNEFAAVAWGCRVGGALWPIIGL